jgi:hypothetical protein
VNTNGAVQAFNQNPYFENALTTPWIPANGATLTTTTPTAFQGSYSLKVTPNGTTAVPTALSEEVPVVTGQVLTYGLRIQVVTGATYQAGVSWYDSSHTFLSSSLATTAITANIWTVMTGTATAPASAVYARLNSSINATPPAANTWVIDSATIGRALNQVVTTSPVVIPSGGYAWLKDPLRPALNVRVDCRRPGSRAANGVAFIGLDSRTRKSNSTAMVVNNSPYPAVVSRARQAFTSTLHLVARTWTDRDALDALLANGSALLFQLPSQYGEADRYYQVGDEQDARIYVNHAKQPRAYSLPLVSVLAPAGSAQAPYGARLQDLCNRPAYATLAAVTSAGITWQQLAQGAIG